MKFKKLTIRNIGSIESKTIDFTANPLGNASLFLISGPTGSGKSIILDAVCLALYGKAVRLDKVSNRENYMDPQFNCASDGIINLNDARQLVRRGTAGALAELVFDGNDGREYTASWSATRGKRANLSARLTASRHIVAMDGSVEANKESECNELIAAANVVGLKFDEFCRTTLLAQGDFTKFLDSSPKEKADILEKVTGTEKFSRIGEKINEKFKEIQESAKALLDAINDKEKQPMKDEERVALVDEDKALDGNRNTLTADKAAASAKKTILERQKENNEKDAKADIRLKNAIDQKATDGYKSAVKTSADWKATLEARGLLKTRDDAGYTMQKALENRSGLKTAFDNLTGGLIWFKNSLGAFDTLDKQITDLQVIIASLKAEYARLKPEVIAQEGVRLNAEKNAFDLILKQLQTWLSSQRNIIGPEAYNSFTPEQREFIDEAYSKATAYLKANENTIVSQRKYDEVFSGFQNHAAAVRASLKKGDKCPVCGNTVEDVLSDETIGLLLKPYCDEINKAKNYADKCKSDCDDLIATIAGKTRETGLEIANWQTRNAEVVMVSNKIACSTSQLSELQQRASFRKSIEDAVGRMNSVRSYVKSILGVDEPSNPVVTEIKDLEYYWNRLCSDASANASEYDKAKGIWERANLELGVFMTEHSEFNVGYLTWLSSKSMTDITELDGKVKYVDDMETTAKAQKESCKMESESIAKAIADQGLVFAEGETLDAINQNISNLDSRISIIDTRKGEIKKAIEVDDQKIESMKKTREKYDRIRPTLTNYETLNSLFGQGGGTLFKKIAQSHLLGVLLENANYYLCQFTDRYELIRQEGSLVVLMKDKQQDETPRPANTLSGGESFMTSLALALGLSSFNTSDFSSDTIFIDEGFGTLSTKCLEGVYETLASLKKVVGKKVGIISHVEYLKDNIHPQIVVEPVGNGLSVIKDPE